MADTRKAIALQKKLQRILGRRPYIQALDMTSLTESSFQAMTHLVTDIEKLVGENNGLRVAIKAR